MWSHLQSIYHQVNKAMKFLLDTEIAKYGQGEKIVPNGFLTLWTEDLMILSTVKKESQPEVLKVQEESHISQFLMNM